MRSLCHLTLAAALLVSLSLPAGAQDEDQYLLSEGTYNRLNDIQKQMENNNYTQAERELKNLLEDVEGNNYERAVTYQTLGYLYSATERYDAAADAFINALEDRALPGKVTKELYYNIAQLEIRGGDYKTGLDYLDKWFALESSPPPEVHVLAATAYYQLRDFKKLIPHIKTAINQAGKPEKTWYDLLLAAYFETGDYSNAANVLQDVLKRYPGNRDYWLQLVSAYDSMDKPQQAMASMELALEQGVLKDREIIQLVQMYLQAEVPYKAGRLLAEKIESGAVAENREHLELLANSWLLAQETEKAAQILAQVASLSNDPGDYYQLGQIYYDLGQWQNTVDTLEQVMEYENFEKRGDASLLLGIAAYHLEDFSRSGKALNRALGFDNSRKQAEWWLEKLESVTKSDSKATGQS